VKGAKLEKKATASFGEEDGNRNGNYGDGTYYVIKPSAPVTTVTITEKATKAATTITITNTKISSSKAATKITASNVYDTAAGKTKDNKGKIFSSLNFADKDDYEAAGAYNKVSYTVKGAGDNQAMLIHVTKDSANGHLQWAMRQDESLEAAEGGNFVAITNEKGAFTIDYGVDGYTNIPKGTYKFTATPIDSEGNAIGKTATVTVKSAPAPKAKVALKSSTIKGFGSQQILTLKTANNIVVNDAKLDLVFGGTRGDGVMKADLLGVNTKGKINKFATKFGLSANDDVQYLP
jgi:hypothetical protein